MLIPYFMPISSHSDGESVPFIYVVILLFAIAFVLDIILIIFAANFTYKKTYSEQLERYKFPAALYIGLFVSLFIPIINVSAALVGMLIYFSNAIGSWRYYQIGKKDILNKKI